MRQVGGFLLVAMLLGGCVAYVGPYPGPRPGSVAGTVAASPSNPPMAVDSLPSRQSVDPTRGTTEHGVLLVS